MRETDQITLCQPPNSDTENYRVWIEGVATATLISQPIIEAALVCDRGWLLIADDNPGFAEFLSIYFFDTQRKLRDTAHIGALYASGSFWNFAIISPSAVSFTFVEKAPWIIQLLDTPKLSVPFLPDTRGVWRGANWRRYFQIRRAASTTT